MVRKASIEATRARRGRGKYGDNLPPAPRRRPVQISSYRGMQVTRDGETARISCLYCIDIVTMPDHAIEVELAIERHRHGTENWSARRRSWRWG